MQVMDEEAASGLGGKIVAKLNEFITEFSRAGKADAAWKVEAEQRLAALEELVKQLKAQIHGLKIAKGKATAAQAKAVAAQAKVEAKLKEARQLLN